jgi:hypothetical protein
MTEAEWLAGTHPYEMIYHKGCRDDRKRRLLACACARRVLHLAPDERSRLAIETSERYADGLATDAELIAARRSAKKALADPSLRECSGYAARSALSATEKAFMHFKMAIEEAQAALASLARPRWDAAHREEGLRQCDLVKDIFGNPFGPRPVISPSWLTPTVLRLAEALYEGRDFSAMGVLGDALEEAGCDDPGILGHCRSGVHVRGCWLVDSILGKG